CQRPGYSRMCFHWWPRRFSRERICTGTRTGVLLPGTNPSLKTAKESKKKGMIKIWHELSFSTRRQVDFYEITGALREDLRRSNVKNGVGYLLVPHTTAGLTINENADPDVIHDLIVALDRLAPASGG